MSTPTYRPPSNQDLPILHADDVLLVVSKPAGLLSVPGRGEDKQDCLLSRVRRLYPDALIVHRLDMATSGIMVLARDAQTHKQLSGLFAQRQMYKRYQALLAGRLDSETGVVDLPLITDWPNRPRQKIDHEQGKPSLTRYQLLHYDPIKGYSRVRLEPETGRSHQLRVHMLSLGHPILGDDLYGQANEAARLMLHAEILAFAHPVSKQALHFEDPAPF